MLVVQHREMRHNQKGRENLRPFIIFPTLGKWYHSTDVGNMMAYILPQKV